MRLSLAAYTFIQTQYQRRLTNSVGVLILDFFFYKIILFKVFTSTSEGGSPLSNSMPTSWNAGSLSNMGGDWRNVYQLLAVVVHSGDAHSGHFITYRRGYHNSK